ncbi:MAG: ABC transporter permease, partial [Wenzhouxiangellaceae bacterium]
RIGIVDDAFNLELDSGENLRAARIDQNVLPLLGIRPVAGRLLTDQDVLPGAELVALIGESPARERFGSVEEAVGARLETKLGRMRIVGVVPDAFAMPRQGVRIWLPMELGPDRLGPDVIAAFGDLVIVARMRDDETPDSMLQRLETRFGGDSRLDAIIQMLEADYRIRPLRDLWADGERRVLMILGAAVALVLIASVLNVAGLWMARWFGRSHELAVQTALGGERRLFLFSAAVEYLVLALPAALLAIPLAIGGIKFMYHLDLLDDSGPLTVAPGMITALIALLVVVVASLPVLLTLIWQMRGTASAAARFLASGGVARSAHGAGLRQLMIVAQIGIAFSLLLVLMLLFSSWKNLLEQDVGVDRDRLMAMHVMPGDTGPSGADARVAALTEQLAALPGVESVSWSNSVPFGHLEMISSISLTDNGGDEVPTRPRQAGPDFFEVAGIELLRGRVFGPEDATDQVQSVVVDQLFVDQYMGGEALGKSFGLGSGPGRYTPVRIVGVVEPVRHNTPDEQGRTPTVYSYLHEPLAQIQLLLRTSLDPESLVESVRTTAVDALGQERVGFVASLERLVRETVNDREPQLLLLGVFSGLALLLVFYGLYALQSYQVATRTAEFGLRKAMGASGRHVLVQVIGRALMLLAPGLALGVGGGWLGARLVADRLYAVSAFDPLLWVGVALAIGVVIVIATLAPARRALRIEPIDALRHE